LNGAQKIEGLRRLEWRLANSGSGERESGRQHEGQGRHCRTLGILTAGHTARAHFRHIMAAIHVILRGGRRFLVVMRFDRTLRRVATRGGVGRPGSSGDGRIKQNDREQTEACGEEPPAIVRRSLHVLLGLKPAGGHYIVTRHSLQAGKSNRCLPGQFTIRRIRLVLHYRVTPRRWPQQTIAVEAILT
jgi:hypothetical protein